MKRGAEAVAGVGCAPPSTALERDRSENLQSLRSISASRVRSSMSRQPVRIETLQKGTDSAQRFRAKAPGGIDGVRVNSRRRRRLSEIEAHASPDHEPGQIRRVREHHDIIAQLHTGRDDPADGYAGLGGRREHDAAFTGRRAGCFSGRETPR